MRKVALILLLVALGQAAMGAKAILNVDGMMAERRAQLMEVK